MTAASAGAGFIDSSPPPDQPEWYDEVRRILENDKLVARLSPEGEALSALDLFEAWRDLDEEDRQLWRKLHGVGVDPAVDKEELAREMGFSVQELEQLDGMVVGQLRDHIMLEGNERF